MISTYKKAILAFLLAFTISIPATQATSAELGTTMQEYCKSGCVVFNQEDLAACKAVIQTEALKAYKAGQKSCQNTT